MRQENGSNGRANSKRGGARAGAGRKKSKVKKDYHQIYTPLKKLADLQLWYGVRGLNRKLNDFLAALHKQGAPAKVEYNETFLKETE